jgi:small subunit ribosomal protein S9
MATERYIEAIGRRKTSTARVRMTPAKKTAITVNGKSIDEYFPTETLRTYVREPLALTEGEQTFTISAQVSGGGIASQSQAVRHGVARALLKIQESLRTPLKTAGLLTRDSRMKERRKFGLKKARRASQWSKR